MYNTVIFDYGNTLCKMGCLANSLQLVLGTTQSFHIGQLIEKSIAELYVPNQINQPDWESVWQLAFASYGVPFDREIGLQHLNEFVSSSELYDYTLPILRMLKDKGTRLILLSNVTGCSDVFQTDLDNKGLTPFFERVLWSSDIGYRKPSRQAFQLAVNSVGANTSSTLMVGDNELADIQGASAFGVDSMLISDCHVVSKDATYVVTRADMQTELKRITCSVQG